MIRKEALREHWPAVVLLALTFFLLFYNLGDRRIAEDEYATVFFAQNIDTCGLPMRFPCDQMFEYDRAMFDPLFPSVVYYNTYIGMQLFGENAFGMRFMPTIFGFLSAIFVYLIALAMTKSKRISTLALLLYVTSVHYHIHTRFARYFGITFFLVAAGYYAYLKCMDSKKSQQWMWFVVCSVALVYSMFQVAFYFVATIALFHVIQLWLAKKWPTKQFVVSMAVIFISAIPQVIYRALDIAGGGVNHVNVSVSPVGVAFQLGMGVFYFLVLFFPFLLIPSYVLHVKKKQKLTTWIQKNKMNALAVFYTLASMFLIAFLNFNGFPEVRKLAVMLLPLVSVMIAQSLEPLHKAHKTIALIVVALLISTNLMFVAPFMPLKWVGIENVPFASSLAPETKEEFVDKTLVFKSYQFEYTKELVIGFENALEIVTPHMEITDATRIYGITDVTYQQWEDAGIHYEHNGVSEPEGLYDYYILNKVEDLKTIGVRCDFIQPHNIDFEVWDGSTNVLHRAFYNKYNRILYVASECSLKA